MSLMNSPDIHAREDHLRHLLDQRATRADLHGRFPSLSEFSDSPSVYSRPYFSPRPTGAPADANLGSYELSLPPRGPPSEPRSPMFDRERLNLPNASCLDLDDDSQCSSVDPSMEDDVSPAASEEELPGISTYGPKMTVHSRAPWEVGEDGASDHEEPLSPSSGKKRSGSRKDGGKRVWGLGKSSSERQSEKRPSTDSNRSQSRPKPSMESYQGNGSALLALAQASMSSTSLAINSPQPTLRDKLSLSRLRPRTPSNAHPIAPDSTDTRPSPFSAQSSANASPMSRYVHPASPTSLSPLETSFDQPLSRSPTPSSYGEYTHPFANPDLVRRAYDKPKSISSPKSGIQPPLPSPTSIVNRSDSNATLTESTANSSMFQSRSNTTMSSLTPVTSLSSVEAGPKDLSPHNPRGKGISGPMLANKPSFSSISMMNGIGGGASGSQGPASPRMRGNDKLVNNPAFMAFGESPAGASIKLISLEQAQAQARERSRSATTNPVISSNYATPKSQVVSSDQDLEGPASASRSRSASSSGKTRTESGQRPPMSGQTSSQGSLPPRSVQRKKSGFMRLFNGKEKERGMHSPPPPVPSLASEVASISSQPAVRERKGSAHRVPVPSLSPSLADGEVSAATGGSGSSSDSHSGSPSNRGSPASRERQLNARRNAPGLSINTSAHPSRLYAPHSSVSEKSSSHGHTITITPTVSESFSSVATDTLPPSSAPPMSSDFIGLSLRPVSTLFSNNFGEQLVSPVTMDPDTGTPTTAATAISPLSTEFPLQLRGYAGPPEDGKSAPMISRDSQDEQSSMVEALQDQILMARRAWQRQIWELEGQVRDLKAEVEELRMTENTAPYCSACGRGNVGRPGPDSNSCVDELKKAGVRVGVVNRPRARTGVGSRFASGT
ncbi:uncharacterized protein B0H18DRAFT_969394 [Fomitopsis serialis]|uniref:uncharacterized protein n=1 Tax=Fomitopsis serialis TaxID=139415 RepID=UPI0020082D8E|nr:uncharacterized protein B0H18DRAFT_969394 [Neoantrodia serialis]KAH9937164.1 hypothetical protein B0H18DRAFT_969394 [Neoantrodia serialis]